MSVSSVSPWGAGRVIMIVINLENQPSYSSYINLPDKLLSHHIEMTMVLELGPEDFSFEL